MLVQLFETMLFIEKKIFEIKNTIELLVFS